MHGLLQGGKPFSSFTTPPMVVSVMLNSIQETMVRMTELHVLGTRFSLDDVGLNNDRSWN